MQKLYKAVKEREELYDKHKKTKEELKDFMSSIKGNFVLYHSK